MDLFLLRPRWRALSNMEDTTQRRTSCPGNQEWRRVWNRVCGRTLSLLLEAWRARHLEDATAGRGRNPRFGSTLQGVHHLIRWSIHSLVGLGTWSEWNLLPQFRVLLQRDYRIFRFCHTQDHSHLDSNEATRVRIVDICRWQVHFVCSKRNPAIQHHVGEKLPLKSSRTERSPHPCFLAARLLLDAWSRLGN